MFMLIYNYNNYHNNIHFKCLIKIVACDVLFDVEILIMLIFEKAIELFHIHAFLFVNQKKLLKSLLFRYSYQFTHYLSKR